MSTTPPSRPGRPATLAWAVFFLSAAVTLLFWALLPSRFRENENGDYFSFYEPVAERILAGAGVTLPDGSPATRYPPGYALFLAAIFGLAEPLGTRPETMIRFFTLAATGVSAVLLHAAAARIWGRRAALATVFLWSTYPFALWLTKQPNSEVPFLVLFFGGFALFRKGLLGKGRPASLLGAAGAILGVAALLRPIALGAGLVLAATLWLALRERPARARLALAAALLAGNFAAILPWEAWALRRTGRVVPLSTGGVPSVLDGLTFAVDRKDFRQGVRVPADVEALMREIERRGRGAASAGDLASLLAEEVRARPLAAAKLLAIKAARAWYATNSERFEGTILAFQIVYLLAALAGIAAAWRGGGDGREMALAVLLLVGYFWVMTVATLSLLRYMVPAMGLLFIPVSALFSKRKDEGRRTKTDTRSR